MKIVNVPIEPIEERYSTQWADWWPQGFIDEGYESWNVPGALLHDKGIQTGQFLDCHNTSYWKAKQLATIVNLIYKGKIAGGDVLFFHDLWFPGIETLGYIRDISGVQFKIAGYLHAGAYDPADLLHQVNMQRWVTGFEQTVVNLCDYIFVGSHHHMHLLDNLMHGSSGDTVSNVHPIGYPVDHMSIDYGVPHKEDIVVFPHRLAPEKQPELFDQLAEELRGVTCVKTKDVWTNKAEYYKLLSKAKVAVSFAKQETFGIAMVEACLLGCYPIAPNALSYVDTMESTYLMGTSSTISTWATRIKALLEREEPYMYPYKDHYSVHNMVKEVLGVINAK